MFIMTSICLRHLFYDSRVNTIIVWFWLKYGLLGNLAVEHVDMRPG